MARGQRRLAAMMLTDLVGYSALTQRDEAAALRAVREHERIVRPIFRSHGGRVVKSLGDGFLVEFPNALDAVECSIELQNAVSGRNHRSAGEPIEMRIGIHLGDVVHRGRDVFGDAVNLVARIEPLSDPGGVCLSQQVLDQVRNRVDVRWLPAGTPPLKNIATPVTLYRIALTSAHAPEARPAVAGPRVAVLPVANLGGRADDEYLADGITEELIQMLSKLAGLRVIGRASMMRYKQTEKSPAEVARELGANAIVEASVRKAGARVRVIARLLDATTSEARWSGEYDRQLRNLFGVQSEISQQIAAALEVEILGPERSALGRPLTAVAEAHAALLKGRYLLNRRTSESLQQALESFELARTADPRLAQAYSGIADANSTLAWLEFVRPRNAFPKARAAALRAVELAPSLSEAHSSLGFVRFLYDRSWVEAEREFRTALELNPNLPTTHQFYSDFLKAMGRLDEAEAEVRRALELDPLSLGINTALGHVLYLSRKYDRAIEQYRRALELDPNFVQTHLWFGRPFLEKGRYDEAIAEVETAVRLSNESTMSLAVLAHAFASAGRRSEAKALLEKLRARSRRQYVPSYWIALIHVGIGDADRAFHWLDRADRERSAWLAWIKVEPRFDSLRTDPRFGRLLQRLNLG